MLVEYYHPFDRGGSEWSTHDLSVGLIKKGQKVLIITPNYGTKKREINDGIEIVRFPFYKKLGKKSKFLTPFWTNNLFWFLYSAYHIYKITKEENIDIIHVQSRNFIVGACLASIFIKKPLVLTLRDYQTLCSFGFCLLKKTKSCNIIDYFSEDFPFFLKNYVQNYNALFFIFYFLAAVRARFIDYLVKFVAYSIKTKVCVSKRQEKIFEDNGFSNMKVIYSSVIFPEKIKSTKKENSVLFVGKLSYGKGLEFFIRSIPDIISNLKDDYRFKIIGGGSLKDEAQALIQDLKISDVVAFSGHLSHDQVLEEMARAKVLVAPSVWEEPFGRVVIEALSQNTPVVASQKGAFPEIIQDDRYGLIVKPDSSEIAKAVIKILRNYLKFSSFIEEDWVFIKKKYSQIPAEKYIAIYKTLIR